jgi:hypothetical protein
LEVGSCFMPETAWTAILQFMLSTVAGMTSAHNCAQLLIVMGHLNFLPVLASNCYPPNFYFLSS